MSPKFVDDVDVAEGMALLDDKQDFRRANYKALKRFYAALAAREYESCNIVMHGDSVISGGFATAKSLTFSRIFTDAIQRMYGVGGVGYVPTLAYLSGWTFAGGTDYTLGGPARMAKTLTGNAETATYTFTGDRFWLAFWGFTTMGNAEISIDGGAFTTFNTNAAAISAVKYDSGPLTETITGTHTVIVRGAAGATIRLGGIFVFNTDYSQGVKIWELGHSGAEASYFTATTWDHWQWMSPDKISPDLVILEFGLNEQAQGTSVATYKANMSTLITNYYQTADFYGLQRPSIVLLGIWAQAFSGRVESAWLPYRAALRDLANERDVAFFDLYDLAGWVGTTGNSAVADLVTNATTTVTSATAFFRSIDIGMGIVGTNIPVGATVTGVTNSTTATISAAATGSGTNNARFTNRPDPQLLTTDLLHPSNRGHQWIADELQRLLAGMPKLATIPVGLINAKGDIIIGTGADAVTRLGIGVEGQVLHVAASADVGAAWADPGVMSRILQYNANPGLATFTTTGFGSAALVTSPVAAANADQSDGPYVQINTATTLDSDATVVATTSSYAIMRPAWLPEFVAVVGTGAAITTSRIWAGLFSATPQASADPAIHGVGFRYDTSVDGTAFWRCWSNDGVSTGTVTVTTAAIAVSSRYRLRIESRGTVGTNATSWRFYINDALVAIHTTNLPGGSSNNLGPHVGVRALAALAARALLVSRLSASYK